MPHLPIWGYEEGPTLDIHEGNWIAGYGRWTAENLVDQTFMLKTTITLPGLLELARKHPEIRAWSESFPRENQVTWVAVAQYLNCRIAITDESIYQAFITNYYIQPNGAVRVQDYEIPELSGDINDEDYEIWEVPLWKAIFDGEDFVDVENPQTTTGWLYHPQMVRDWAIEQDLQISPRGRLPKEVIDQFERAHGLAP